MPKPEGVYTYLSDIVEALERLLKHGLTVVCSNAHREMVLKIVFSDQPAIVSVSQAKQHSSFRLVSLPTETVTGMIDVTFIQCELDAAGSSQETSITMTFCLSSDCRLT